MVSLLVCVWFLWCMSSQSIPSFFRKIISQLNTDWPGLYPLNIFVVDKIANATAAKIPYHMSYLSTKFYLLLYIYNRLPKTKWIHSNISLEVGFSYVLGFAYIPYSLPITYFLNSLPMNYDTRSYVISVGLGYLDNNLVSNKFTIVITCLQLYYVILDHPLALLIILMHLIKQLFYFFPSLVIT